MFSIGLGGLGSCMIGSRYCTPWLFFLSNTPILANFVMPLLNHPAPFTVAMVAKAVRMKRVCCHLPICVYHSVNIQPLCLIDEISIHSIPMYSEERSLLVHH
jgi:hypothetical protein